MARILVIRGGAIGDFILTLPALRLLRENFPEAHIEILGYKHIVALAENRFYAQATRSIEYAGLAGFFIPRSKLDPGLVDYFSGFQQVISYLYDPDGFFEANVRRCGVRNFLVGSPKLDDSAHAAEQLARPLQGLALYLEKPDARVYPSAQDRLFASGFLGAQPTVAIHPGSGSPTKNWPVEKWVELCRQIGDRFPKVEVIMVGGEADQQLLDPMEQELGARVARNLPLPELAAVLERCALFIGHDSGVSHLAAAAGTRSLLLFGPTEPSVWAPANPWVEVLRAPSAEMAGLSLEEVAFAVFQTLAAALGHD